MKKLSLLKLMLLLCALIAGSGNVWATDVSISSFSSLSGSIDSNISYATYQGDGTTTPVVSSSALRIYKPASGKSTGGYITVTADAGYKISSITITNSSDKAGTIKTSVDGGSLSGDISLAASDSYTVSSINASNVSFYNCGSDRLSIAGFSVTYASTGGGLDAPSISPGPGAVVAGTTITLTQASADQIRYTTNGVDPTKTTGTVYSTPIAITTPTTIKAIAIKGDDVSSVASASYTISVTKPSFDVAAGKVNKGTLLTISATAGHTIIYTTDGTDPSYSSPNGDIYDSPIEINSAMTVKAIAVDGYENESDIKTASYTIAYPGAVNITPNYTFFGKAAAFSGDTNDEVSGTQNGITVTYTRNTGSCYANTSGMRFYKDNVLKIDAPIGKVIISVSINTSTTDVSTAPAGTYHALTGTWTDNASSVSFSRPKDASSYITISEISVALAPIVSVGAKGYATYCNSEYALDFTDKSIKAYTISSTDGSALTLTQKNKVAKNEPVLLYSSTNSDSKTIPVIADAAATATVGNKLKKGDDAAHTWASGTAEHYVLATATVTPGFYRANNNTVASNKAYLDLTGLSGAHSFTLDLGDGDVTGIATVSSEKEMKNASFYNLAGQRIAQPTKGLYIVNGKKVIIK